jgi:anti-sigma factor RsiW
MIFPSCMDMRLAEFVDGELNGADRLMVVEHLRDCPSCSAEVEDLREVGDRLRQQAPMPVEPLAGLAGGVVARVRAERALSWRGMLDRAVDGWHWMLVGSSALGAAAATTVLVAALLHFGPEPSREDSIAGLMTTPPVSVLSSGEGALYISSANGDTASVRRGMLVMYLDLVAPEGRLRDPDSLSENEWELARKLVLEIKRGLQPASVRASRPVGAAVTTPLPAEVSIRFVTTTGVSAKGL